MIPADVFDYLFYVGGIASLVAGAAVVAWQTTLARRSAARYSERRKTIGYGLMAIGILAEIARPFLRSFVID